MADHYAGSALLAYIHREQHMASFTSSLVDMVAYDTLNEARIARAGGPARVQCGDIVSGRNEVAARFHQERQRGEWLFWVDDDMGFAPDSLDRLLASADAQERPIVGGLCFARRETSQDGLGGFRHTLTPTIFDWAELADGRSKGFLGRRRYPKDSLVRCGATGSAFLVIHRSVIDAIYDANGPVWYSRLVNPTTGDLEGEDISFCARAGALGIPVHVDTSVKVSHAKVVWLGEEDYENQQRLAGEQVARDLLWIVPTRGRPTNAVDLHDAWKLTTAGCSDIVFVVDSDDPELDRYRATGVPMLVVDNDTRGMTGPLNKVAANVATQYQALGFMGDDHRPRTPGFDAQLLAAAGSCGLAYGNDLLQGERLPTAVVMTANIVNALGFMVPPDQRHLYLDDFWLTIGREIDSITYLPDVVLEHLHPAAGKAANDDGYAAVNAPEMYSHDREAFERYKASRLAADVAKLKALK